jgi:hypothetical protein
MARSTPEPLTRLPAWAKKAIPILVSVLILYYYFHDQDWRSLWAAATQAHLVAAVLAIVIPQLLFWFFDVLITERHMIWFHGPFSLRTFFWVRGAIYILMILNTSLGGGGILLYLQRKARISWRKLWGIVLFRFGLTMWGIGVLLIPITLAMHHYGLAEKARINIGAWWALLIFGLAWLIEAWIFWHHKKRFGLSKMVAPNPESEFWTAFRLATRRRWLLTWVMAMPPFALSMIGWYFPWPGLPSSEITAPPRTLLPLPCSFPSLAASAAPSSASFLLGPLCRISTLSPWHPEPKPSNQPLPPWKRKKLRAEHDYYGLLVLSFVEERRREEMKIPPSPPLLKKGGIRGD